MYSTGGKEKWLQILLEQLDFARLFSGITEDICCKHIYRQGPQQQSYHRGWGFFWFTFLVMYTVLGARRFSNLLQYIVFINIIICSSIYCYMYTLEHHKSFQDVACFAKTKTISMFETPCKQISTTIIPGKLKHDYETNYYNDMCVHMLHPIKIHKLTHRLP